MTGARFPHLMAPGRIGTMTLRNRIVHAPMSLGLGAGDGTCGERFVAYYAARAKGGAGLVNIGTVSVGYPEGAVDARQIALSDDRFLPSIRGLVAAVHAHGARIMVQLNHNGLLAGLDRAQGRPLATPSTPVVTPNTLIGGYLPEELAALAALARSGGAPVPDPGFEVLAPAGIARIVAMFAAAAARARAAGVDAVEIHAGHGYLLQSFLSPVSNRRTDDYGGSVGNRARILIEVVTAVRAATGADYPVLVKLDGVEFGREDGSTAADIAHIAAAARAAGADAITATGYADMAQPLYHSGAHTPQEERLLVPYAAAIRRAAGGPVVTAGRIEPEDADRDIAAGLYDFVAMGRKLLADPDLPNRLAEGRPEAVRPCIYCYECISQAYFRRPVRCAVNPEMGRETEAAPLRPRRPVTIVGGGVTGMETARRLAAAGAAVTLVERAGETGGEAIAAGIVYPANRPIVDWLRREIAALGVTSSSDAAVPAGGVHVDATGRERIVPAGTIDAGDPRAAHLPPERVVIVGAGVAGLGLAHHLAGRGARVTVVDEAPRAGRGVAIVRRWRLLHDVAEAGVTMHLGVGALTIEARGVAFRDAAGARHELPADHVVVADPPADAMPPMRSVPAGAIAAAPRAGPRTIGDAFLDAAALAAAACTGDD